MLNKTFLILGLIVSFSSNTAFGAEARAVVKKLTQIEAKTLLMSSSADVSAKIASGDYAVDENQSFRIKVTSNNLYLISVIHSQRSAEYFSTYVCSLFLLKHNGQLISAIDTVGSDDNRPWTCETLEAISFSDQYPDGHMRVIAIYEATAPSSERFNVPVILTLDWQRPDLKVDEFLTSKVAGQEISSIKEVRTFLKKYGTPAIAPVR